MEINFKNNSEVRILVPTFRGLKGITIKNISYCKADNYYSIIYLNNSTHFTASITLKDLENLINCELFFRCHNSYLININYFSEFDKSKNLIYLEDNQIVKLSKNKKNEFLKILNEYVNKSKDLTEISKY